MSETIPPQTPLVVAVARDEAHRFSKPVVDEVELIEGLGVRGDAHSGATAQHLARIRRDPAAPNLRQVHLLQAELFDELVAVGFQIGPGQLGENITTSGVDLLGLPEGTRLHLGQQAVVRLTGLRNACQQIDDFADGLRKQLRFTDEDGHVVRRTGVMGVVEASGVVRPGDPIAVELPAVRTPLAPV